MICNRIGLKCVLCTLACPRSYYACCEAGLKAYTTTYTAKSLNICRESCGGHGYAAVNRLGQLRSDHDIFQTFEGESLAGYILSQLGVVRCRVCAGVCQQNCSTFLLASVPKHFSPSVPMQ